MARWLSDLRASALSCRVEGELTIRVLPGGEIHARGPGWADDNPELDVIGWEPPPWLRTLLAVHDGIGPWWGGRTGWGRPALLPWAALRPLTACIRFGEENITFDPADCLLLTPDDRGGGVALCERQAPVLRPFDGQRHALGPELPLQAHLDGLLRAWTTA